MRKIHPTLILFAIIFWSGATVLGQSNSYKSKDQEGEYSSYKIKSKRGIPQTKTVDEYLEEAQKLKAKDPEAAIEKVEEALVVAFLEKGTEDESRCYQVLGDINFDLKNWDLVIENYELALSDLQRSRRNWEYPDALFKLAKAEYELARFAKAKNHTTEILEMPKGSFDRIKVLDLLGEIELKQQNFDAAIDAFEEVENLEQRMKNPKGMARAQANRSRVYVQQEKEEEAEELIQQSQELYFDEKALDNGFRSDLEIEEEALEDEEYFEAYNTANEELSNYYRKEKKYDKEIALREEFLANANTISPGVTNEVPKEDVIKNQLELGRALKESGKNDEVIFNLKPIVDSLAKAPEKPIELVEAIGLLAESYEEDDNTREALVYYKNYLQEREALYQRQQKEIARQRNLLKKQQKIGATDKEMRLRNKQIELLEKDRTILEQDMSRQKLVNFGLLLLVGVVSVAGIFVYRNAKERRNANQLLALKSLRSQMNPHFIFNALNSVNHFMSISDERQANKFLAEFSRLMRLVLENSQKDFVPLVSEVEVIELYLKLEHYRFRDKFQYSFELDDKINTESVEVPPMLIQPYIENAVWHGLRYKEEFGQLDVKILDAEDHIVVTISDNGIGRKKSQELKTTHQKKSKSTGLANTANRLQILNKVYDTKFDVAIADLDAETGEGTLVTLSIPKKNKHNHAQSHSH